MQSINSTQMGLTEAQLHILYLLIHNTTEYTVQTSEQIFWNYFIHMINHINNNFVKCQEQNANLAVLAEKVAKEVGAIGNALSTNIVQNNANKLTISLL